jgi:hypothetical protein
MLLVDSGDGNTLSELEIVRGIDAKLKVDAGLKACL